MAKLPGRTCSVLQPVLQPQQSTIHCHKTSMDETLQALSKSKHTKIRAVQIQLVLRLLPSFVLEEINKQIKPSGVFKRIL